LALISNPSFFFFYNNTTTTIKIRPYETVQVYHRPWTTHGKRPSLERGHTHTESKGRARPAGRASRAEDVSRRPTHPSWYVSRGDMLAKAAIGGGWVGGVGPSASRNSGRHNDGSGRATTNGFTDNRVSEGVPEHWVGGLTLNT
jgi:hypothetical protein